MTIQEAELWIRRLEGGNFDDAYRPSSNLSIVMRLMLHSHLKAASIYRLTVEGYRNREFIVTEEDQQIIERHIRENRLSEEDLLIQVSDRANRKKFQHMVGVYHSGGRRPELGDFYFAGLGRESKEMKRR